MRSCSVSEPKLRIVLDEDMTTSEPFEDVNFRKLLMEAVEDGLSILGDCSKQALYHHLKSSFNIGKQEIPDKIEQFSDAIEKIFGHSAKLLQIEIMKNLHKRVKNDLEYPDKKGEFVFIEYVKALGASFRIREKISYSLYKLA